MSDTPATLNGFEKPFYVIIAALGVLLFALAAFTVDLAVENDSRLDRIEDTRVTREDMVLMERRIRDEMRDGFTDVKNCINRQEAICE